jgi:hypothetical protein
VTQTPPKPQPSVLRETGGEIAKESGKLLGMAMFQLLSILGLIVLGAAICGAGLYFQIWVVAIIGGVLIGAGVLWAVIIGFLFFGSSW